MAVRTAMIGVCMCVWVVGEMVSLGEMEDLARGGDLLGNGLN
jgi:hypothetical protein